MNAILEKLTDPVFLIPIIVVSLLCGLMVRYVGKFLDWIVPSSFTQYKEWRKQKAEEREADIEQLSLDTTDIMMTYIRGITTRILAVASMMALLLFIVGLKLIAALEVKSPTQIEYIITVMGIVCPCGAMIMWYQGVQTVLNSRRARELYFFHKTMQKATDKKQGGEDDE